VYSRWKDTLKAHNVGGQNIIRAKERNFEGKIVLFVDHYVPQPDHDAGSRVVIAWLRALTHAGYIVKFWPDNLVFDPVYTPQLQDLGIEVFYGIEFANDGFSRWVEENGKHIECVILSRPTIAPKYISTLRKNSLAKILYYGVDLHYARLEMQANVTNDTALRQVAIEMRETELGIWRHVDGILYPSEVEIDAVKAIYPEAPVSLVNLYAFDTFGNDGLALEERSDIVFVAGFAHPPNVDAAEWLVEKIMPLVWQKQPNVRLFLVGSNPTEKVQSLASSHVEVTGWVSDEQLNQQYRQRRLAVIPLRYGAGVKSKVVEALKFGLPLVTTPVGAQGLESISEFTVVTEKPDILAKAILDLLIDDEAWLKGSQAQIAYAQSHYSREILSRQLIAAVKGIPIS
jgi:glycosyltransferase involved in cell wall biosynthesis